MGRIMVEVQRTLVCGILSLAVCWGQAPPAASPQEIFRQIMTEMQPELNKAGITVIPKGDVLVFDSELFKDPASRAQVALFILPKLNPSGNMCKFGFREVRFARGDLGESYSLGCPSTSVVGAIQPLPPAETAPATEILTNSAVIALAKAGLPEDVIIAKVNSSGCHYELSVDALIALKQASVQDRVVRTMLARDCAKAVGTSASPSPVPVVSDKLSSSGSAASAQPQLEVNAVSQSNAKQADGRGPSDWRKQLESGATLGTVRRLFVDQRVIVSGAVEDLGGSVLLMWELAHETSGGRYATATLDHLASTYKGKAATVIAVQLNELKRRELKPNALGEIVAEDGIVDPYFDIVVRFDDGTLAMLTEYPRGISDGNDIELTYVAGALAEEMSKSLPGLIGKTVYAVGFSRLYQPDTSLEDLTGFDSALKQLSPADAPLLQPLTILAVKYIDSTGVVFKLKLPNGKEALSFTPQLFYVEISSGRPLMERVTGTLLSEVPKMLTQGEIDAVKRGTIFRGMGKDAVDYLLGFSEKENDWGRGGKQLIYLSGRIIVYLDKDGKVEDWQSFDKK